MGPKSSRMQKGSTDEVDGRRASFETTMSTDEVDGGRATHESTLPTDEVDGRKAAYEPTDAVVPAIERKFYQLVVAIKFGTFYTRDASSWAHAFERCTALAHSTEWSNRTLFSNKGEAPTTILIKPDGNTIGAFGYDAETKYSELAASNTHKQWYYFQHFMMNRHREGINRDMTLTDVNGRTLPAITVFGLYIRFLKDNYLDHLGRRLGFAIDIYWVLTVPAIWNDAARQFMREAAVFGGIDGKNLTIGLEPECAFIYCRHEKTHQLFPPGTKYLVVDVEDSTIGITALELGEDTQLRQIVRPSSSELGGNRVTEAFLRFLDTYFGEHQMSVLRREYPDDYMVLLQEFECRKRTFNNDTEVVTITLPSKLFTVNLLSKNDLVYKRGATKLSMMRQVFETFYNEYIAGMIGEVSTLLAKEEGFDPDCILFVGGLSESTIIQTAIRTAFPDRTIIIPDEAGLAVLKGAVMYGHMTSIIEQ